MKKIFKKILQYYLKYITRLVLFTHRPIIIAIAGSTNKTFVKNEINNILVSMGLKIRSNPKSFNTEIGLTLAILGLQSGYNSYKDWLPIILRAPLAIFQTNFPKNLVLELGVSDPGDMKYLLSIIRRPQVVIITDITQRYLESFDDMDKLTEEYEYLIKKIKPNGLAILNYDNKRIKSLAKKANCKVDFFGLDDSALWQAKNIQKDNFGQEIEVVYKDTSTKHKIKYFGQHHVYSLLISLAIKKYIEHEKK